MAAGSELRDKLINKAKCKLRGKLINPVASELKV